MRWMSGLGTAPPLRLLLDHGGRGTEGIGRRRRRRVGGVGRKPRFEGTDPLLQLGNASIAFAATRAFRSVHTAMLASLTPTQLRQFLLKCAERLPLSFLSLRQAHQ